MRMDAATIVHHDDEKLRLVSAGALLLVHIRLRYTHEESAAVHAVQEDLRATVGRHALLVIVSDVRAELSERARSFSRHTSAEFADWVVCVANVIEPRGLIGATVRCIMAGLRALDQPRYPAREFASVRAAAMWMAPLLRESGIALPFEAESEPLLEWAERVRAPAPLEQPQSSLSS